VDDEAVLRTHGIELLHLPTVDTRAISIPMIHDGVAWVNAQLGAGHRVFIHCEHGIGRSALLALCVLVSRGMAPLDALERAKTARPVVSPSPEQLGAFLQWLREWRGGRELAWVEPSLEALMIIAYRHLRQDSQGSAG
jgi:protein-tyrosine phosphatase